MHIQRAIGAVGLAVLLTGLGACAARDRERPLPTTRVESGGGTINQARKYLEGRWILESFEVRPPGRAPVMLKGTGILNYDDFGNLRMEIRADQETSDQLRAAGIVIRDGVISTDGRTVIDIQNRTLTYVLEGQPANVAGGGPLAANRPRHWEVTEDALTLTTKDDGGQPVAVSKWKKSP
jgi:hypothetical protein